MMAAHNATMECYRRSMIPGQPPEGRDLNLKHAQKLSSLYEMQLETLNKHRGKVQQKVTVEHVHVAAGGQAIVGNIEQPDARTTSTKRRKVAPPQIEHQSASRGAVTTLPGGRARQAPEQARAQHVLLRP